MTDRHVKFAEFEELLRVLYFGTLASRKAIHDTVSRLVRDAALPEWMIEMYIDRIRFYQEQVRTGDSDAPKSGLPKIDSLSRLRWISEDRRVKEVA